MPSTWYFSSQNRAELIEEVGHLVAAVVEDVRVPVRMKPLAAVGVLVQVRAVEVAQAVAVAGEVARHPVEDHADAALVQGIDQVHEVLRAAVAAGRGEEPGHLVAPRPVERVLHDRQELDVRESVGGQVVGQHRGEFAVGQRAVPLFRLAPPRPEVHLVDRDGGRQAVAALGGGSSTRRRSTCRRDRSRPRPCRGRPGRRRRTGRSCRIGSRSARGRGTCTGLPG